MSRQTVAQTQQQTQTVPQVTGGILQRKCNCGQHTIAGSECAECSRKRETGKTPSVIQTKLTINRPGDKYEQEADGVADKIMRMPEPSIQRQIGLSKEEEDETIQTKPISNQITPLIQRKVELKEEEEEEEVLQAKQAPGQSPQVTPELTTRIQSLRGGGQPLPESTRAFFEPRFGHDFSQVRVHTDAKAAESARAVNAQAFTVGRDVAFAAGQYSPGTREGRRLLAHELVHAAQQSTSLGAQQSNLAVSSPGEAAEHEADHIADTLSRHMPFGSEPCWPNTQVGRKLAANERIPRLNTIQTRVSRTGVRIARQKWPGREGRSFYTPDEAIRDLLMVKPLPRYDEAFRKWSEQLRELFDSVTGPEEARRLNDMLSLGPEGNAFAQYFYGRLDPTTRARMLSILRKKFPARPTDGESGKGKTPVPEKEGARKGPATEENCWSGTEDECGEYDASTFVGTIEGKKVGQGLSKRLPIPDGKLKGLLSKNWEVRVMQKGDCCSYITFRVKSGKKEGVLAGKFKWEVTPLRGEFRYRRNTCTGKSRCSGQISAEGMLILFPWKELQNKFEKLGWKGRAIPQLTINLVLGSNVYAAPPKSVNIVRFRFFVTLRADLRWNLPPANIRLRLGLTCPFANVELGKSPVWSFTWEKCWESIKDRLPRNLTPEVQSVQPPVLPPGIPPTPKLPIPKLPIPGRWWQQEF